MTSWIIGNTDEGSSLYGDTVSVTLKAVEFDTNLDFKFQSLDTLTYDGGDTGKFLIRILRDSGETSLLEVSGSDTIAQVKREIIPSVTARERAQVELAGVVLDDERALSGCGVVSGTELSLVQLKSLPGVSDSDVAERGWISQDTAARGIRSRLEGEAKRRGWLNKARARVIFNWDGLTSDGNKFGLPLRQNEFVMIGRVVNENWYEGYLPNDLNKCGYIPRNFVQIESIYDEELRGSLGPAVAQELPPSVDTKDLPQNDWYHPKFLARLANPVVSLFLRKVPDRKPLTAGASRPSLPPLPFPSPTKALDILQNGTRVRLRFQMSPPSSDEYPTITALLSLVPGPQSRISYATVELQFEHDTIVELEPKWIKGEETEVHHTDNITDEMTVQGGVNHGPAGLNLGGRHTKSKVTEFYRRTRGTIVGDGEGSSLASWVFKEDPGKAGRFGLDHQQMMVVKLHVLPVRVDYQVNVVRMADDGGKGNWIATKGLSSGRQRYYFKH